MNSTDKFYFFFYSGFPLNEGQHSRVRGHDRRLRWGLYWHINGMGVHRELGLTQSLVSELITTSLWAKNSKGFLAYHCFNYRGGEEKGHHTALWLHGRKQHRLGRNQTDSLQGIHVQFSRGCYCNPLLFLLSNVQLYFLIFSCFTYKTLENYLIMLLKVLYT